VAFSDSCATIGSVSRFRRTVCFATCCLLTTLLAVAAARAADFTTIGNVTNVVDGDTIDVRLAGGRSERVRVIGIDTPERGACWASEATAATRRLALGKRVTLVGDATQDTRDRYGRLLAYVWLPGGMDLGFQLVAGGHAKIYVYNRPFKRLPVYQNAESGAKARGVWKCGKPAAAAAPKAGGCHPSYAGACLDPAASDYDCAGGGGNGPKYTGPVRVVGPDPFGLDRDGDGYACG
jgi:endonuclease YncB( thermonuclease family)